MISMQRKRRLVLRTAIILAIALCTVIVLQWVQVIPPLVAEWGDGTRGTAWGIGLISGSIQFRTASGMKQPTGGRGLAYGVQTLSSFELAGVHGHLWKMILKQPDGTPLPGDLGTYMEVRATPAWPILIALLVITLCVMQLRKERRDWLADTGRCRNCGYDLRATPERCPECGLVSAGVAVTNPTNGNPLKSDDE
jgi:hypothetical protein